MPRRYTLGKRAEQQAATRARIVVAALALIRDGGLRAAGIPAVAAAADVAPATVRNHFPGPGDLADAVADAVVAEIQPPGVEMFAGLASVTERVERLARELAAFFERSGSWWDVQQADPDLAAAWAGRSAQFSAYLADLAAAAVAPLGDDRAAAVVTSMVAGPPLYFALREQGLSSDEAVAVGLGVVLPWLEGRGG